MMQNSTQIQKSLKSRRSRTISPSHVSASVCRRCKNIAVFGLKLVEICDFQLKPLDLRKLYIMFHIMSVKINYMYQRSCYFQIFQIQLLFVCFDFEYHQHFLLRFNNNCDSSALNRGGKRFSCLFYIYLRSGISLYPNTFIVLLHLLDKNLQPLRNMKPWLYRVYVQMLCKFSLENLQKKVQIHVHFPSTAAPPSSVCFQFKTENPKLDGNACIDLKHLKTYRLQFRY